MGGSLMLWLYAASLADFAKGAWCVCRAEALGGRLMERDTDLVWFKWGMKHRTSQGGLRSCPTDRTTLFAAMKPSSGCFQPSSDPWGEASCWLQHNRASVSHCFLLCCLNIFSFGLRVLLQRFNIKFQSFWATLTFNLPSASWQFLSWFAVIKN